jgi:hypothetical protein
LHVATRYSARLADVQTDSRTRARTFACKRGCIQTRPRCRSYFKPDAPRIAPKSRIRHGANNRSRLFFFLLFSFILFFYFTVIRPFQPVAHGGIPLTRAAKDADAALYTFVIVTRICILKINRHS